MTRTILACIFMVILSSGLALGQTTPGVGAGFMYTFSGEVVRPSLTWTLALTKAPSVVLQADGLLASDGTYGVGLSTPVTTFTKPLFKLAKVYPSEGFANVLAAVSVGGAVLTEDLSRMDAGLYAKVTAFTINF